MNFLDILRITPPGILYSFIENFVDPSKSLIGKFEGGFDAGFRNNDWSFFKSFFGDFFNDIQSHLQSYLNSSTGAAPTGVQETQMEREDNAFQRGVADMEKAGLNSALMYGNGAQPSASSAGAGSPGGISDLLQLFMLPLQMRSMEAQIKNVNAGTKKVEEETSGVHLDNLFKDNTLEARTEAERLANSLKRSQISKLDSELDEIVANTRKLAEEAKTEESKRDLNFASALLARVNAFTAVELLPYSQALAEAQTEAQRNYAALMAVQKLYQSKLIKGGYVDAICEQMKSSASSAEANAAVDQINSDIRSGKFGNDGSFLGKVGSSLLQGTVLALDQLRGIASVGIHFGKSLNKTPKSPDVNPGYNHDPFGYLAGE